MTTAERVSLYTSVLAVVISLVATYFQFFWRVQDVRLQWYPGESGYPSIRVTPPGSGTNLGEIQFTMSPSFVLVNAGNQPVSLAKITLEMLYGLGAEPANVWIHGKNPPLSACYGEKEVGTQVPWDTLTLNGEDEPARPMTIGPGDIVSFRAAFRELRELVDSSWRTESEVTTCFVFDLVDADGSMITKRIPALQFSMSGGRGEVRSGPIRLR